MLVWCLRVVVMLGIITISLDWQAIRIINQKLSPRENLYTSATTNFILKVNLFCMAKTNPHFIITKKRSKYFKEV